MATSLPSLLDTLRENALKRPRSSPSVARVSCRPVDRLEQDYTFLDPFTRTETSSYSKLLEVLAVDHADLQAANAAEAAANSAAAVLTKKTASKTQQRKAKKSPFEIQDKLLQSCQTYTSTAGPESFLSSYELAKMIIQTAQDGVNDPDTVQAQLFGLVGVEGMDLIAFVVQNLSTLAAKDSAEKLEQVHQIQENGMAGKHTSGAAFSIQTASEQVMQKQLRKAQRKHRGQDSSHESENWLEAAGYDPEVLRLQREFAMEEERNQSTSLLMREFGELEGGYETSKAAGQLTSAGMVSLPESTRREYRKGYERVVIPAKVAGKKDGDDSLIPISSLEDFAQSAFHGMTHLNRLQSKLFQAAYHSNQNLLVCAPTGAGKTNVAMLTILQEIKMQLQHSASSRKESRGEALKNMKIIYVAPMKALAQEVVTKFGQRLASLRLKVAELTGDMQLTKKEIEETHVIVTTPEKWDVITRKSSAQQTLLSQVRLLIIDEVHLLADERGPVIETIVARTLRRVETTQSMIRIVGLSATLPNYADVAHFLKVPVPPGNAKAQNAAENGGKGGLFFFDSTYRPVPLDQTFIGVNANAGMKDALGMSIDKLDSSKADDKSSNKAPPSGMSKQRQVAALMNKLALSHCSKQTRNGEQVMIFVHSRKETAATLRSMIEIAQNDEDDMSLLDSFLPPVDLSIPTQLLERVQRSRNKELKELLSYGMGIHHAGMLRSDRNLSEQLFEQGHIRVLCCTATLAWGVNLPAHSVLIKGTQVYNTDKGGMTQLSMLDVMQIFGRAGRPQYDTTGDAVMVTTQDQLPHYLRLLTAGVPMESALIKALPDHLNAEIVSGTVSNLEEACEWLRYTFLYVRMLRNPLAYGMRFDEQQQDPDLIQKSRELIMDAAQKLAACRMIKIKREKMRLDNPVEGPTHFAVTSLGRVASHFYIRHTSVQTFNDLLDRQEEEGGDISWEHVLLVLCSSNEFEQLKSREDEMGELERLKRNFCRFEVRGGGLETYTGKTSVLLQALIARARVSTFTLISDTNYVSQNASRVCRALFEMAVKQNAARRAEKFLQMAKCIDQKMWLDQNPLLQLPNVPMDIVAQLDNQKIDVYDILADPHAFDLSEKVKKWVSWLPWIDISNVQLQPIAGNMLKLKYELLPLFPNWKEHAFGGRTLGSWVWVEDAVSGFIYHSEYTVLHQSQFVAWQEGTQSLSMECYLPVFLTTNDEAEYVVRVLSDRFVGMEAMEEISYKPRKEETTKDMYTKLLQLHPQPLTSLQDDAYESLYRDKFQHMNPIQTQVFHDIYHDDGNVLLCAPTGSGKTLCAELAMMRVWKQSTSDRKQLIVYVAPLKALAREKVEEWKLRFGSLGKVTVEVTGDTVANIHFLLSKADIIVTTPEKWDMLTRSHGIGRKLMQQTALVVIDEVHLVGDAPRGAVLEVLVSRLRRFQKSDASSIRLVGLSTALANPKDVGHWLGASEKRGHVYNFRSSVRPVPLQVHVQGFPERHYVSRMAAMNKPVFMAIQAHSKHQPALVFVSSRAQTKLTALDLIAFCVSTAEGAGAKPFLHMEEEVMDELLNGRSGYKVQDENLRHTLAFGIGLHHAGLRRGDRELVEQLFRDKMIQVVISTSTLAWGVNLPAHLVVVKGTQFFQNGRYQPYPMSDILQMIGRAGRPLLDTEGVACVLLEDSRKNMVQRCLYEPLAIESCLGDHLTNHLNAEIAAGLVRTEAHMIEYLSWSLLFQRAMKNSQYYGSDLGEGDLAEFFRSLVQANKDALIKRKCVRTTDAGFASTSVGKIAAALYVDTTTVAYMHEAIDKLKVDDLTFDQLIQCLICVVCEASSELQDAIPLRHYEVQSNLIQDLSARVAFSPLNALFKSQRKQGALLETHGSEVKSCLLMQMHLQRLVMPSSDFANDLRSLLDQMPRLLSALTDLCAMKKKWRLVEACAKLSQGVTQSIWPMASDDTHRSKELDQLPHVSSKLKEEMNKSQLLKLQDLVEVVADTKKRQSVSKMVQSAGMKNAAVKDFFKTLEDIPSFNVEVMHKEGVVVELKQLGKKSTGSVSVQGKRFQKPRPYGFYIALIEGEDLVHLKHVVWRHGAKSTFNVPIADSEKYTVRVWSDAIAGMDTSVSVPTADA